MAVFDDIKTQLSTLTQLQAVYYGGIPSKHSLTAYNYAVVSKQKESVARGSRSRRWNIYIVMENQIPDKYIAETVIPQLLQVDGLKVDETADITYEQEKIPNTSILLEAGAFVVVTTEKRC